MRRSPQSTRAALRNHAEICLRCLLTRFHAEPTGLGWALPERSALDFYLFVFTRWVLMVGIPLGEALADHHRRVVRRTLARDAVEPPL